MKIVSAIRLLATEQKVVFLLFVEFISAVSAVGWMAVQHGVEFGEGRGGRPLLRQPRAGNFLPTNTQLLIAFLPRIEFQIRRNFLLVDSRLLIELPFLRSRLLLTEIIGFSESATGSQRAHKASFL